jgi:hypothetical protein
VEDKVEKTLRTLSRESIPNDVSRSAEAQLQEFKASMLANERRSLWSNIMHARIVKVAAVIALMAAGAMVFAVLNRTESKVWAIERSIEALKDVRTVMMKGTAQINPDSDMDRSITIWAVANSDRSAAQRMRMEMWGLTRISDANSVYVWGTGGKRAYVGTPGETNMHPWLDGRFFEKIAHKSMQTWQVSYGTDPDSGRQSAFVTCSDPNTLGSRSLWFEFDVETSMLVRLKQWLNPRWEGRPQFDVSKIEFNPELPQDFFDPRPPDGVVVTSAAPGELTNGIDVVMNKEIVNSIGVEPGCGVTEEGLSTDDACVKLVKDYYDAVMAEDWDTVRRMRTDVLPIDWSKAYGGTGAIHAVLEVGKPRLDKDCSNGLVVPVTLSYQDGSCAQKHLVVISKVVEGRTWYAIFGTWAPSK